MFALHSENCQRQRLFFFSHFLLLSLFPPPPPPTSVISLVGWSRGWLPGWHRPNSIVCPNLLLLLISYSLLLLLLLLFLLILFLLFPLPTSYSPPHSCCFYYSYPPFSPFYVLFPLQFLLDITLLHYCQSKWIYIDLNISSLFLLVQCTKYIKHTRLLLSTFGLIDWN